MRAFCFALAIVFAAAFINAPLLGTAPVSAQASDDLEALYNQVRQLSQEGKYAAALPIAEQLVTAVRNCLGEEHWVYATALSSLAGVHQELGRFAEAEALAKRALAIAEKVLGPDHPYVASHLNNLSALLQVTNRLAEAEPLLRRALAIDEKSRGPDDPNVAIQLNNLADLLRLTNRHTEAEPLLRRALAINEKRFGPDHPSVATSLNNLGLLLQDYTNRHTEAELLYRRALAIAEKNLGPDHPNVATPLGNLARLLLDSNRLSEAEPLMRRAIAIVEKSFGPEHPNVAIQLSKLGLLLQHINRLDEAESTYRRALAIVEKSFGPEHPNVANELHNLGGLLLATNRLAEAESMCRRALAIDEKSLGPDHPNVARDLNCLALLLHDTNRRADAESLMRRAAAISEKALGPDHAYVAGGLNNLAELLRVTNRLAEAEPLYRRALAIDEKNLGPDHPNVAVRLNNLSLLLQASNRLAEAEPLMRRALAIDEKSLGLNHPSVGRDLNNLGRQLQDANRLAEAEPLMRRALAIDEKSLGPDHPNVAIRLNNLAELRTARGDWGEAVDLYRRAKPILIARKKDDGGDRAGLAKTALAGNAWAFRAHARALHRADADSTSARDEGFELAQWALQTGAADALTQMSVRSARGAGPLAVLVRERQNLITRRQGEMRRLDGAAGRADAREADELRAAVSALDKQLDGIDKKLVVEFPEYAELANPKPLTIAATQALLKPNEALILFLDVPQLGKLPEESIAWAVTEDTARWHSIPLGTNALADRVAALRCGLDASSWDDTSRWDDPSGWPQETALEKERVRDQQERMREQKARQERCKQLLGLEVSAQDWPPFDPAKAYELYQALLAPFAELTQGKDLIIVPSGALTSLPLQVLVTEKPDPALTGMAAYRQAAWLAFRQPVTVLPSVGSLQALRKLGPSHAAEPYIAFGNPLLLGASGNDKRAWDKQRCLPQPASTRVAGNRGRIRGGVVLRAIDLAELRRQSPLPEAADELCAVAAALGSIANQTDTVWLGERATERNLKALSREGKLKRYRVVHFATHGLLSGESAAILNAKAEPALILTPPQDGATAPELEEDNGLLTASEVAQLELDADWVVLSACNTAAGDKGDAEALSGLARAFFYAKARALLVSHWSVSSDAAVKLTTRTFAELKSNPLIGRAEALRRSMVTLIKNGKPHEAHPASWAPFALVGEGSSSIPSQFTTQGIASRPASSAPPSKGPASAKAKPGRQKNGDWKSTIWKDTGP